MGKGQRNRNKRKANKQREFSDESKRKIMIGYYKSHPDLFVESHLKVKLNWWQKLLLKLSLKWAKDIDK